MARYLDAVPFSGIIRIREMMYRVRDPFRLDQGDVSFDAPATVKEAMARAIAENRSHYLPTAGVPRLRELLADKLRRKNGIPVASEEEILVTQGGIHGIYVLCQALLEPGDEVIVPDPHWPPAGGNIMVARGVPRLCPLRERLGWRYDLDELAAAIGPRTKAIYLNTPHNPTGGVLTREDLQAIGALAEKHDLWIIADEAYEDVLYDGAEHVSIASIDGLYSRTVPVHTFSKTYAMTGLRLGYIAVRDAALRDRVNKVLFMTVSNVASVVQFGGIGALEGPQDAVDDFRVELDARRRLFYGGIGEHLGHVFDGAPPQGAFYAFLRVRREWSPAPAAHAEGIPASRSWALVEELITCGRVGCVPGVDFGPTGEGYVRFCFARDRAELAGAIQSMRRVLARAG